jgi:hypothetical protein
MKRLFDQDVELLDTIILVSTLIPEPIARHQKLAGLIELQFRTKPLALILCEGPTVSGAPPQDRLTVHLVDILTPGTRTARERKLEFGERNGMRNEPGHPARNTTKTTLRID